MTKTIGLIATTNSAYMRVIFQNLLEKGCLPKAVFLGSKLERLRFKYQSLCRIRQRHGWREVFHRWWDRRKLRRQISKPLQAPDLRQLLAASSARVHEYDRINSGHLIVDIIEEDLDVLVLAGCGMVSKLLASRPRLGCVNSHPAILPGLRGVDVVAWALLKRAPLGVTAHLVAPEVDAGAILQVVPIRPEPGMSYADFHENVVRIQAEVAADAAFRLATGQVTPISNEVGRSELCFATNHAQRCQAARYYKETFSQGNC